LTAYAQPRPPFAPYTDIFCGDKRTRALAAEAAAATGTELVEETIALPTAVRIPAAKHEVPGKKGVFAEAPGIGLISPHTGSITGRFLSATKRKPSCGATSPTNSWEY
jgi:hypothetical protein